MKDFLKAAIAGLVSTTLAFLTLYTCLPKGEISINDTVTVDTFDVYYEYSVYNQDTIPTAIIYKKHEDKSDR